LFCPEPVFRTKAAIEKMQTGDVLTVLTDDLTAAGYGCMAAIDVDKYFSES